MKKLISILMVLISFGAMAQDGHIIYNDHSNYRMYGANGLPRTDHANVDTLTNVLKGDLRFDTLNSVVIVYDGTAWVDLDSDGNTLDQAYDSGGAGVGRTITADNGAVKVAGADGLLVTGTYNSGAASEFSGVGAAMIFNPEKAAFRVGQSVGTEWNNASIGEASIALGSNVSATGTSSVSIGSSANVASGSNSVAIGDQNTASGDFSFGIGSEAVASGDYSKSIGKGTASESFSEIVTGLYNTDYTPASTTAWSATDRLFVVGNGTASISRSDALIITKNGNLTMPTTTGAFSCPVLTTTQRNALTAVAGMIIYNSTTGQHEGYDGAWNAMY